MFADKKKLRVGFIGDPGMIEGSHAMSTKKVCSSCGNNSGNLVFRYAVDHHLDGPKKYIDWDFDPNLVRETCDVIVFPAANQINPRYNWVKQAEFIEKVDLPCVVVGLGAQAPDLGDEVPIQEGTLRWLKAIADRSHSIGVRGEYTADVLAKIGITNTVVTGCPSNFINPNPNLGSIIEKKLNRCRHPRSLVINDSAVRNHLQQVERKLINWMRLSGGFYICQSPENMIALCRKRFHEIDQNWLEQFHKYLTPDLSYQEFLVLVKQHFLVFLNAGAWLEFLSSTDLSLGTRMHGTILSIQSGTPGIIICHDSRTKELSDTVCVPRVSRQQFLAAKDVRELINMTNFDGNLFNTNRNKLAVEYINILTKAGLSINDNLSRMAPVEKKKEVVLASAGK